MFNLNIWPIHRCELLGKINRCSNSSTQGKLRKVKYQLNHPLKSLRNELCY